VELATLPRLPAAVCRYIKTLLAYDWENAFWVLQSPEKKPENFVTTRVGTMIQVDINFIKVFVIELH